MTAVQTPPPPTPVERRCERCGARLSAEQEWCLDCGAAVSTTVAGPRGWRPALAVVGVLLALALIAVVLALVELAKPAEEVTEVPQTPTPAATATAPATGETPQPTPESEVPGAQPPGNEATPGATPTVPPADLAEWPQGRTAWTVILNSSGTREDAERLGSELAAKGVPGVGVLDSDDFQSLGPDSFIVFSGQYENREEAEAALAKIREPAGGGSTRRIVPNQDDPNG